MKRFLVILLLFFLPLDTAQAIEGHCVAFCDEPSSSSSSSSSYAQPVFVPDVSGLVNSFFAGVEQGMARGRRAVALNDRGNEYYEAKQYAKAISYYREALRYAPGHARVLKNIEMAKGGLLNQEGVRAWRSRDFQDALAYFEAAYELNQAEAVRDNLQKARDHFEFEKKAAIYHEQVVEENRRIAASSAAIQAGIVRIQNILNAGTVDLRDKKDFTVRPLRKPEQGGPLEPQEVFTPEQIRQIEEKTARRVAELKGEAALEEARRRGRAEVLETMRDKEGSELMEVLRDQKNEDAAAKDPRFREIVEKDRELWRKAEELYRRNKQSREAAGETMSDEEFSELMQIGQREPGTWPGPVNPEEPLANPLGEESIESDGMTDEEFSELMQIVQREPGTWPGPVNPEEPLANPLGEESIESDSMTDEEFSELMQIGQREPGTWPGPVNPEEPLVNPVAEEEKEQEEIRALYLYLKESEKFSQ